MESLSKEQLSFISDMTSSLIWPLMTIGLLLFFRKQIIPLFEKLKSVKVGSLEAEFKELSVSNQSLMFLDGVAGKRQWTFYKVRRKGERNLGPAFVGIINDLLLVEKQELINKIKLWLLGDDENHLWFASEIIGYYKLTELKNELLTLIPEDTNSELNSYQLNCIWAYARITDMGMLGDFLLKTNSNVNQSWLLFVYKQMPDLEGYLHINVRIAVIKEFLERTGLNKKIISEAREILEYLENKVLATSKSSDSLRMSGDK